MGTPLLTKRDVENGALKPSEDAFNRAFQTAYTQQSNQNLLKSSNDAKLAQLIKGSQLKQDAIAQNQAAADAQAKAQGLKPGTYSSKVSESGYAFDPREPKTLADLLTPAQKAAESEGGKKAAEWQQGGNEQATSNIGQMEDVQKQLQGGKRDWWDRNVGGALSEHETLMGMVAPQEKARRDAVHNAVINTLHDAGISRPTQWDIQRVFGQEYDPASDDKTNIDRITNAVTKLKGHQNAMNQQAENLQRTGYVTPGLAGNPRTPISAPAKTASGAGGGQFDHLSDEQLQQMLQQLQSK